MYSVCVHVHDYVYIVKCTIPPKKLATKLVNLVFERLQCNFQICVCVWSLKD